MGIEEGRVIGVTPPTLAGSATRSWVPTRHCPCFHLVGTRRGGMVLARVKQPLHQQGSETV